MAMSSTAAIVPSFKLPIFCALIFVALAGTVQSASHGAPAPAVDCSSLVLNLADCLSFVTNGSTIKKPEGSCCSGLKTVLKTNAECLCEGFKNSAQLGVTLNVTKALTLPAACHVSAPSVSNCGLTAPGAAPALSPMASSPIEAGAPSGSMVPNGLSPAVAPTPGSSGGSAITVSVGVLVLSMVAAAAAASSTIF